VSRTLLETIRCEEGRPAHLEYHQQRAERSLRQLGYPLHLDLSALIAPPDNALYRCRVLYDAASARAEYIPYQTKTVQTLQLIQADTLDYALKYADRAELEYLFAQRRGADDILIVKNGLITDTSIANIAFFNGAQWLTPKRPLLAGTTRERLLDEKRIIESDIAPDDLADFEAFALLNAMVGFQNVKDGIIAPMKGVDDAV